MPESKYKVSTKWEVLFVGRNGSICYGLTVRNLNHDPVKDRAYQNPFKVNHHSFYKKEWFISSYAITEEEYNRLHQELLFLPEYEPTEGSC
jgi:hypothetical protein